MSQPLARLYDLALRSLDEQERRADALRGRLGPVLAAAALGASLLSGPLVGGARPASVVGKLALAAAIGGLVVMAAGVARLVGAHWRPFGEVDLRGLVGELERSGYLHDEVAFYETAIAWLGRRIDRSAAALEQLAAAFTGMLWGIHVMLCGLALAAIVG